MQILYALGEYENSQLRVNEMFDQLLKADHLSAFLDAGEAKALRLNVMHFKTPYVALAA
jgi:hypothetical protein